MARSFLVLALTICFFGGAGSVPAFAEPIPDPAPLPEREAKPEPPLRVSPERERPRSQDAPTPSNPKDIVVHDGVEKPPKPPKKIRRLLRIGALGLTTWASLAAIGGVSLGMDVAIFGQEFHNQARTFSLINALMGTVAAASMVWPLGLALDGNGDFWATTITALVAGGAAIGVMYAWAHGDPDRLLAQSFTPGFFAFTSAIVVYELTSDTSRRYREQTGEGDAWIGVGPSQGGAVVGLRGRF